MNDIFKRTLITLVLSVLVSACSGDKTFNDYARAGDTVAVAAGWKQDFNKENITVTITPSIGVDVVILPGSTAIRGALNFYPDPLSSAIVSRETGVEQSTFALTYEGVITANFTKNDKDWYNKVVFIDLPLSLPTGLTQIVLTNTAGASVTSIVEIIDGIGAPSTFTAQNNTKLTPAMFDSMTRVENYTVNFTGSVLPYAIELTLYHDPDLAAGGSGNAYVANPLGYKKNLLWSDDGVTMKVILTPANSLKPMDHINDFKFYIAGGLQNLVVSSVSGFDANGDAVTGISATSILGR
ncbi:MAG: hypothetical protein QM500_06215 [Methylococcales bacterium]